MHKNSVAAKTATLKKSNFLGSPADNKQSDKEQVPIYEKVTLTTKEAAEYSNIGINKIETFLKSPRCPFVLYVGAKKLVKRKEFERFISENIQI